MDKSVAFSIFNEVLRNADYSEVSEVLFPSGEAQSFYSEVFLA